MDQERTDQVTETEQIEIDGQPVTVNTLESGVIEVPVPEGLTQEARDKFIADVKEKSKTVGSYYRKLQELNVQQSDPAWIAFKQAYEQGTEDKKEAKQAVEQPKVTALWEDLGLDGPETLADYIVDHPDAYAQVVERRAQEASRKAMVEEMARQLEANQKIISEGELERQIREAGLDPKEVRAYAAYLKAPFSAQVFEAYRLRHAPKTDPVVQARLQAQEDQIQFVDCGTGRSSLRTGTITKERLAQLSRDDLRKVKELLMEQASQE